MSDPRGWIRSHFFPNHSAVKVGRRGLGLRVCPDDVDVAGMTAGFCGARLLSRCPRRCPPDAGWPSTGPPAHLGNIRHGGMLLIGFISPHTQSEEQGVWFSLTPPRFYLFRKTRVNEKTPSPGWLKLPDSQQSLSRTYLLLNFKHIHMHFYFSFQR